MNLGLVAGAALLAVAVAVRSTWSPCGLSMLSTVTPLAERARGHRFAATAAWFVVGAIAGGATLGAGAALLAFGMAAVDLSSDVTVALAALAATVAFAADLRLFGFRLPMHTRQVDEVWLGKYRPWVYGVGFGWQIGVGLATYIMTAGVYLLIVLAALSASPTAAFLLALGFGTVRGLAVLLGARITGPNELFAFHRRFDARRSVRPRLRHRRRRRARVRRRRRRHEPRGRDRAHRCGLGRDARDRASPGRGPRPRWSRPPEAIPARLADGMERVLVSVALPPHPRSDRWPGSGRTRRKIPTTSRSSNPTAPSTPRARCWPARTRSCTRCARSGSQPGDTVAAILPNGRHPMHLYLAALQAGLYYVPINYRLSPPEVAYILQDSDAKAFVSHERFADLAIAAAEEAGIPPKRGSRTGAIPGFRSFDEVVDPQPTTMPEDRAHGRGHALHVRHHGEAEGREARARGLDPDTSAELFTFLLGIFGITHGGDNVHLCTSPNYHTAVTTFAGNALHSSTPSCSWTSGTRRRRCV